MYIYFKVNNVTKFENVYIGSSADILELAIKHRQDLSSVLNTSTAEASEGELAAMVSFAIAFPNGFMALVDTYDVKRCFSSLSALSFHRGLVQVYVGSSF